VPRGVPRSAVITVSLADSAAVALGENEEEFDRQEVERIELFPRRCRSGGAILTVDLLLLKVKES